MRVPVGSNGSGGAATAVAAGAGGGAGAGTPAQKSRERSNSNTSGSGKRPSTSPIGRASRRAAVDVDSASASTPRVGVPISPVRSAGRGDFDSRPQTAEHGGRNSRHARSPSSATSGGGGEGGSPIRTPQHRPVTADVVASGSSDSQWGSRASVSSAASGGSGADGWLPDVGSRVCVRLSKGEPLGTVRFVGATSFARGQWVGVELDDDAFGRNDGSVHVRACVCVVCSHKVCTGSPEVGVDTTGAAVLPGSSGLWSLREACAGDCLDYHRTGH